MRTIAFVCCLLAPQLVSAQEVRPFKLIVTWGDNGVFVTDYPSKARCLAAEQAVQLRARTEQQSRKPEFLEGGGVIVPPHWRMEAMCIPG